MGHAPGRALGPGEAMRIPTGGALPDGADAVVPVEDAIEEDGAVTPAAEIAAGDCFTPAGADLRAATLVLAAGRRIGGPELGVLATVGVTAVPVYRKPRFGVASTGDELVDPAQEPAVGQVRDSNRYAIAGGAPRDGRRGRALPARPRRCRVAARRARDDARRLRRDRVYRRLVGRRARPRAAGRRAHTASRA